jgi:hypothetical protein
LNTGHTNGTVTDTMDIIKIEKREKHLNPVEKCHIYEIIKDGFHMNDIIISTYNTTFETLHQIAHMPQSPV